MTGPDTQSRDDLIVNHLDLTTGLARKYFRRGLGLEFVDLEQEGAAALVVAAGNYDPARGPFRPFAIRSIRLSLLKLVCVARHLPEQATDLDLELLPDPKWEDDADPFDKLWDAVCQLPEKQRYAFIKTYGLDGFPVHPAEQARARNVNITAIYRWKHDALRLLREALSDLKAQCSVGRRSSFRCFPSPHSRRFRNARTAARSAADLCFTARSAISPGRTI